MRFITNKTYKRGLEGLLTLFTVFAIVTISGVRVANNDTGSVREQARDTIFAAASKYRLVLTDIMPGYEYSSLKGEQILTRIEALTMISRAFGELPEATGDTLRKNPDAPVYTDIPGRAESVIANLNRGRVLAVPVPENTDEKNVPAPLNTSEPITLAEIDTLLRRVYALYGTRLQDDFYAYVNKEWLDNSVLPENEDILDMYGDMAERTSKQEREIMNNVLLNGIWEKETRERKLSDYYKSILDMDARNKTGVTELKPYLDAIDAAVSLRDFESALVKTADELAFYPLLNFRVDKNADGTAYDLYLSVTDDAHRPDNPERYADYQKHLEKLFALAGDKSPADNAKSALEIAVNLAEAKAASKTPDIIEDEKICTSAQLRTALPNADIKTLYEATGLTKTNSYVISAGDDRALNVLGKQYNGKNLNALKAYVKYMLLDHYCEILSQDFFDAIGDYGFMKQNDMNIDETALSEVSSRFAFVWNDLYAEHYVPIEADMDVLYMMYDFIAYYKERIAAICWMSDATKQTALKKLDKMGVKSSRPVVRDDLCELSDIRDTRDGGSYFNNLAAVEKAKRTQRARNQGQPVDKFDWGALRTTTMNAYYDPENNQIMFPAAFLQAPLYTYGAPEEQNLARIGWIIAHEITHAFDVNGSKYDENGKEIDWWTEADKAEFEKLCKLLIAHYDGYEVAPCISVNGENTLAENMADLGGLSCAIAVLKQRKENPDYQRFFISMAQIEASTMTREMAEGQTRGDIHSPDKARVNKVIQTMPEFYEAFGVKEGDGMYLPPEKRIKVW